jgi:amino acid transporter
MFRNRSVVEIMVLIFTIVVAFAIVSTGAMVAILEIKDSSVDTDGIVNSLLSIISGILGALLGLLAGKSESMNTMGRRPDGTMVDITSEKQHLTEVKQ